VGIAVQVVLRVDVAAQTGSEVALRYLAHSEQRLARLSARTFGRVRAQVAFQEAGAFGALLAGVFDRRPASAV